MAADKVLELLGAPGSPYTRKMLALMRYRHIPYRVLWGGRHADLTGYPMPKVQLLPTFYFPDSNGGREAVVDSTFILRRLEQDYPGRSAIPGEAGLAFLDYLIEDFADEWLTKAMFHYRWSHQADIDNAGPLLTFWHNPQLGEDDARGFSDFISKRQIERLHVVGSNETTAATIEASFKRFIPILSQLIETQGYVLGARPSAAGFALYGQLTQLALVDPTPAALLNGASPRLRAWVDRVDDLSGLDVDANGWLPLSQASPALEPLLQEIGRVYVPIMLANADAITRGEDRFSTRIDGREWTQPVFAYQAKCLAWMRQEYAALDDTARREIADLLTRTGCGALIEHTAA
ncbi:glutathione S-transferase N-terminal domain-containing protein [Maricaulis sp.]|uniref:glutathione S-transferase family protein n=1 Tax=Maricaulis sp. TaxID=1486257 RepID=UPI00260F5E03|nr:glutathione S-transferase N-terminal domain-containing protein [Maricaulis sp.]